MNLKESWKKMIRKINRNKSIRRLNIFFKKLVIPGFEGIPLFTVMRFFIESLVKGILFQRAEAITYRIFISVIPMFMALFAAISFLDESIRIQLMDFVQSIVPDYTWPAVYSVISEIIMKQNDALLYSSFGVGLFLVLLSMNSIITSLNVTYFKIQTRSMIKQLFVCLIMILVFGIIIIAAVGIFVGASFAIKHFNLNIIDSPILYSYTIQIMKWVLMFVLVYLFISALFYFAPANKKYFRFFSAGSTFSTIMLIILLYALNFYFSNFSTYNVIYGSIGALFAILLWLYWSSVIILIGFDLNVSIYIAKNKQRKGRDVLDHQKEDDVEIVILESVIRREEIETNNKLDDFE